MGGDHKKHLTHAAIVGAVIFDRTVVKTFVGMIFTEIFLHFTVLYRNISAFFWREQQNYFC